MTIAVVNQSSLGSLTSQMLSTHLATNGPTQLFWSWTHSSRVTADGTDNRRLPTWRCRPHRRAAGRPAPKKLVPPLLSGRMQWLSVRQARIRVTAQSQSLCSEKQRSDIPMSPAGWHNTITASARCVPSVTYKLKQRSQRT